MRRWVRGWTLVAAQRHLQSQLHVFFLKKALLCDPKLPVKRRIHAFYSTCAVAVLRGACEWAFTQSMFHALRIWERPNECWADHMKRTGPIVARQLKKNGHPRLQTSAMRRVRTAAWQIVRCPNDARGRRYWEESATCAAMKSGERPASNCPRRIIGTARSGNAPFLVDQPVGSALSRVSLGMPGFRNSKHAIRGLSGTPRRKSLSTRGM